MGEVRRARCAVLLGASLLLIVGKTEALCPGDCDGDGRVYVDELVQSVDIALGSGPYRACRPTDQDRDGTVGVHELTAALGSALQGCPPTIIRFHAPELFEVAGPQGRGVGVLPNGRRVEPPGKQVIVHTLPLNMALTPDDRHLIVTNDGRTAGDVKMLQIIDTESLESDTLEILHRFGLAVSQDGRVFLSNPRTGQIRVLHFEKGELVPEEEPLATVSRDSVASAIALAPDGNTLYILGVGDNSLWGVDVETGSVQRAPIAVGNLPYSLVISPDGNRAYITSWGINNNNPLSVVPVPLPPLDPNIQEMSSVAVVDLSQGVAGASVVQYVPIARSLSVDFRRIFGGSHPSAIALSPDGKFLYITATNVDLLVVLDTESLDVVAEVRLNVFDDGPLREQIVGLQPNGLAVSPDGSRVFIADAGINAVQVVEVDAEESAFRPIGFVPAGFYPTAVALSSDGNRLYIANGKGAGVGPNGEEMDLDDAMGDSPNDYYIGRRLLGTVTVIDDLDNFSLESGTQDVARQNGFVAREVQWVDGEPGEGEVQRGNPVPIDFGSGPSRQIKHVVFILKENRTYDQVFGDLGFGNGEPSLTLYGQQVTPNQHALAGQFAIGDNFYSDGEVSIDGHEWTDQANANDFIYKMWPLRDVSVFDSETIQIGQEGFAKHGYIFQSLLRQEISFRVYGETFYYLTAFQQGPDQTGPLRSVAVLLSIFGSVDALIEGSRLLLEGGDLDVLRDMGIDVDRLEAEVFKNVMLEYPTNILADRTDVERAELFIEELNEFEASGELPTFMFLWLPNDHTFGARAGAPTPRSAVADNDEALGRIVDALSHSSFWPDMAIFVTEDDAQDGQDHVSAQRTTNLLISPYVKRGYVSPIHHSQLGMLKTMELILGADPMSQFDRYATDMRDYFTAEADLTPYEAMPRQIPVEINPAADQAGNVYLARAAVMSESLNLDSFDEAGENLSRVLWLVHKGEEFERSRARWWDVAKILVGSLLVSLLGVASFAGLRRRSAAVA